jgi:hypothetical protein
LQTTVSHDVLYLAYPCLMNVERAFFFLLSSGVTVDIEASMSHSRSDRTPKLRISFRPNASPPC